MWVCDPLVGEPSYWQSRTAAMQAADYCRGYVYYVPVGGDR